MSCALNVVRMWKIHDCSFLSCYYVRTWINCLLISFNFVRCLSIWSSAWVFKLRWINFPFHLSWLLFWTTSASFDSSVQSREIKTRGWTLIYRAECRTFSHEHFLQTDIFLKNAKYPKKIVWDNFQKIFFPSDSFSDIFFTFSGFFLIYIFQFIEFFLFTLFIFLSIFVRKRPFGKKFCEKNISFF